MNKIGNENYKEVKNSGDYNQKARRLFGNVFSYFYYCILCTFYSVQKVIR